MYPLKPIKVYALETALEDPRARARMDRMLAAVAYPPERVQTVTEANLPDVVAELRSLWPGDKSRPAVQQTFSRPLVFTAMDLTPQRPDVSALVRACGEGSDAVVRDVLGRLQQVRQSHPREKDRESDFVCWTTQDFGLMSGCPHGCLYCGSGRAKTYVSICLNVEEYIDRVVGPTIEAHPEQKCFRLIGWTADLMAFEPEYGAFEAFTAKLAEYPDRYGYFHTATANVDWLAEMPHRDRLIGVWTVGADAVARCIEPGAASAAQRFAAGRKCIRMGIPARYKFKPIIPIRGWREAYAEAIAQALEPPRPESIGLCMIMWMDLDQLDACIPLAQLDPAFVDAARAVADDYRGTSMRTGPFPHEVRSELYRFFIKRIREIDADVPLYLSTETRRMWDELGEILGQRGDDYVCGCGSICLPGNRLATCDQLRYSTYTDTPA